MSGMQNSPLPSKLMLLSDLQEASPGEKIRFLGCVANYSTKTAILTLEHNHPAGNLLKALVDVKLLVNTLKANETQAGEWVNTIGYVVAQQSKGTEKSSVLQPTVLIQAIVLWSSGPFKLDGYERSLDKQSLDRAMKHEMG